VYTVTDVDGDPPVKSPLYCCDEADELRFIARGTIQVHGYRGTGRPAAMNAGWHRRLSQRAGLFFDVLVPVVPQSPAARNNLVWRSGGDLVLVEARERREDSTYETNKHIRTLSTPRLFCLVAIWLTRTAGPRYPPQLSEFVGKSRHGLPVTVSFALI